MAACVADLDAGPEAPREAHLEILHGERLLFLLLFLAGCARAVAFLPREADELFDLSHREASAHGLVGDVEHRSLVGRTEDRAGVSLRELARDDQRSQI